MDFCILGPLEVRDGGRVLRVRGRKQRALLALLLLNANRTLAIGRIVDELWGEDVPETAQKMVQIYVSQLRKLLPDGLLRTRPPGYALELEPEQLDLRRFERLSADGRAALADGDPDRAAQKLAAADDLWRGPALAEFASEPFAAPASARLEELRVAALEERLDAELELGRHGAAVAELEELVAQHPLRERLRSQHMLALYRSGRHAEALASYQRFRRTLAEELGIEPSVPLRELERQMLRQDPVLELPVRAESASVSDAVADVAYARSGDLRIAYQVVGDGPLDLVLVHGLACTFQPGWEYPKLAAFYRRLASIGRLILFDKRGTGLSDRVSPERLPDLETRMDDVRAVLDAVASERSVLIGVSEGGPMSALFAATHPQRTLGLILLGTFPRQMWAPDYPFGTADDDLRRRLALLDEDDWAAAVTRDWLGRVAPDVLADRAAVRWYTSYVRRGASPGAYRAIRLMNAEIDVRHVLPTVRVPTLVLYRAQESMRDGARVMGERIPGARAVELAGNDHLPWEGDAGALLDEIERFASELRDAREPDRVLATLLSIQLVGATRQRAGCAERLRDVELVRRQLARFRGREVELTGADLVASFDGPARAIRCADAILGRLREVGIDARAGVHTGECELRGGNIAGLGVETGLHVAGEAAAGEVLVSGTVRDLVAGSGLAFADRGTRELPGVGEWHLFALQQGDD